MISEYHQNYHVYENKENLNDNLPCFGHDAVAGNNV